MVVWVRNVQRVVLKRNVALTTGPDFRSFLESSLRPPEKELSSGVSAGSFPEQRLLSSLFDNLSGCHFQCSYCFQVVSE